MNSDTKASEISGENPWLSGRLIFPATPIHSSPVFQALQCDSCGPLGSVEAAAHLVPEAEFAQLRLDFSMFRVPKSRFGLPSVNQTRQWNIHYLSLFIR